MGWISIPRSVFLSFFYPFFSQFALFCTIFSSLQFVFFLLRKFSCANFRKFRVIEKISSLFFFFFQFWKKCRAGLGPTMNSLGLKTKTEILFIWVSGMKFATDAIWNFSVLNFFQIFFKYFLIISIIFSHCRCLNFFFQFFQFFQSHVFAFFKWNMIFFKFHCQFVLLAWFTVLAIVQTIYIFGHEPYSLLEFVYISIRSAVKMINKRALNEPFHKNFPLEVQIQMSIMLKACTSWGLLFKS